MNEPTHDAWIAGLPRLEDLVAGAPAALRSACELANVVAYEIRQERNTCVVTSHALAAYLRAAENLEAGLVRVTAVTHPRCRCATNCHGLTCQGAVLGSDGGGERLPKARDSGWWGHLVVTCGGYLLDPTVDQSNNEFVHLGPLVLPLPNGWNDGESVMLTDAEGTFVRYSKFRRQVGWKSAPDARPSHWRPIVNLMLALQEA